MAQNLGPTNGLTDEFEFEDVKGGLFSGEAADSLGDFEEFSLDEGEPEDEAMYEDFEDFEDFSGESYETEQFGELEGEEFSLGSVWRAAKKAAKVVAPLAKRFAPQIGSVIGGALGGPAGAAIGGKLGSVVKSMEAEDEGETEDEMNAIARVAPTDDQLSESMATAASKSAVGDAMALGSAITITIASRSPIAVKTVTPVLAKASADVARRLIASRDPRARMLVRTLPTIQRRTIATLTRKAQTGKPVTPRTAVRVMAKHANRTLNNPASIAKALAGNATKKRQLDRRAIARAERYF